MKTYQCYRCGDDIIFRCRPKNDDEVPFPRERRSRRRPFPVHPDGRRCRNA